MNNYKLDRDFLDSHMELIELKRGDAKLLLAPSLQGRVMTSCAEGDEGYSFGWINYKLISSGEVLPHCNNWGGEDRFWMGPEGGQYAIFFAPGTSTKFDFEDWQAPSIIDTEGWEVISIDSNLAKFETEREFTNYSGTKLNCRMSREVSLLSTEQIEQLLNIEIEGGLTSVGFSSNNTLTNIGERAWCKESGALSIWILGQFKPSEQNHIIIPVKESNEASLNDSYFGKIPAERLSREGNCYYFRGDGNLRGKLGTPPEITQPVVLALDEVNEVLTVVKFTFESDAKEYINSQWALQDEPYKGDVVNSYNDGPLEDGTVMGGFYEIETSSKALLLSPNQSHTHNHTTIHIKGEIEQLQSLLNILIDQL